MRRLKVWFYPLCGGMVHDEDEWYRGTVPFCKAGIEKWVDIVPAKDAEFYHMGQIREFQPNPYDQMFSFWHWPKQPGKHIVDLEGDYAEGTFREEFTGAVRVACGAPHRWRADGNVFPRPTMSRQLLELVRGNAPAMPPAKDRAMGFIGKKDSWGVRAKVVEAALSSGIPSHLALNEVWGGPSDPSSPMREVFRRNMEACSVSLCIQGENAVNTARFYETCCYGRFPVVIGHTMLPGEDIFDTSFACQIPAELSALEIKNELQRLGDMTLSEMVERGKAARAYWESVLVPYFADPTKFFLEWLVRQGLWHG